MKFIISTHFFFLSRIVKAFLLSSATRMDSRGSGGKLHSVPTFNSKTNLINFYQKNTPTNRGLIRIYNVAVSTIFLINL